MQPTFARQAVVAREQELLLHLTAHMVLVSGIMTLKRQVKEAKKSEVLYIYMILKIASCLL
jgi:hypothetical protein